MQSYELFFHYLQLTKLGLCRIKRDHLVNFYILLEKSEKCVISVPFRPISTKFNVMTQKCLCSDWLLKISISKF